MTPQHFHTSPTSCTIFPTMHTTKLSTLHMHISLFTSTKGMHNYTHEQGTQHCSLNSHGLEAKVGSCSCKSSQHHVVHLMLAYFAVPPQCVWSWQLWLYSAYSSYLVLLRTSVGTWFRFDLVSFYDNPSEVTYIHTTYLHLCLHPLWRFSNASFFFLRQTCQAPPIKLEWI